MPRHREGQDRSQTVLLPEYLDDCFGQGNVVRVADAFVDELDLAKLDFENTQPAATGRLSYYPPVLLKIYIYGYLNRVQSSGRLETEVRRNLELIWLTCRLVLDLKMIANFPKDSGEAIPKVCREFIVLCRKLKLFSDGIVAIDGSNFKAASNRDKNFTDHKLQAANAAIGRENCALHR